MGEFTQVETINKKVSRHAGLNAHHLLSFGFWPPPLLGGAPRSRGGGRQCRASVVQAQNEPGCGERAALGMLGHEKDWV